MNTRQVTLQIDFVDDLPLDSGGKFGIVVSELG